MCLKRNKLEIHYMITSRQRKLINLTPSKRAKQSTSWKRNTLEPLQLQLRRHRRWRQRELAPQPRRVSSSLCIRYNKQPTPLRVGEGRLHCAVAVRRDNRASLAYVNHQQRKLLLAKPGLVLLLPPLLLLLPLPLKHKTKLQMSPTTKLFLM